MIEKKELLRLTELLYSCWIISSEEETVKEAIPTGGGVLENGLRDAVSAGAFPDWARQQLHFVETDMGLTCIELPYIQKLATELKITADPNPSYTRTELRVGKPLARRCLARLNLAEEDAKRWGDILRKAVEQHEMIDAST